MSSTMFEDPFFKRAIGCAKALAKSLQMTELTPHLVLAGIILTTEKEADDIPDEINSDWKDAARVALENSSIKISGAVIPLFEKMALSKGLKNIIKLSENNKSIFFNELLKFTQNQNWQKNELLQKTIFFTKYFVGVENNIEICAEKFCISAYLAFEHGEFTSSPGLTGFFAVNQAYFSALAEKHPSRGTSGDQHTDFSVSLSEELISAITAEKSETDQIIAALNIGLKSGVDLVNDRAVAYHEAGHALAHHILRPHIPTYKVTIIRTNDYSGAFMSDRNSPHWHRWRREDYLSEICVCLAGRAAELIKFGFSELDSGAASDLQNATVFGWDHIVQLGLDPEFGPISLPALEKADSGRFNWLAEKAQERLQVVLKEAEARTDALLRDNWIKVEALANVLIAKGEVDLEEFMTTLQSDGLGSVPGSQPAESVPIERQVVFAPVVGSIETTEGTVRHAAGDAILTGEAGERWPVSRATFESLYEPTDSQNMGEDGLYRKISRKLLVLHVADRARIDLSQGRGVLLGNAGDWVVDYGDGDMAIVGGEVFARTYRLID
jgi:hypothetical protein